MSIYKNAIIEITKCKPEEAQRIEQIMRDFPGCSTLDHLRRKEFFVYAKKAYRYLQNESKQDV